MYKGDKRLVGQIRSSWNALLPYLAELALAAKEKVEGLKEGVRSSVAVSTR
jgi:hypothetical protein